VYSYLMSGVTHELEPDPVEDPDDDGEFDHIAELFLTTGPEHDIVLHNPECNTYKYRACDCIPVTLRRGAKA
jgi:hypothetical protein